MTVDRTVYILGAGFSKGSDFQLPVMDDLLANLDPKCFDSHDDHARTKSWLDRHFSSEQQRNAEEVLTFLDCGLLGPLFDPKVQEEQRAIKRSLGRYLSNRLRHNASDKPFAPCRYCQQMFAQLSDTDTIITFNYDSIVEHSLFAIGEDTGRRAQYREYVTRSIGIMEDGPIRRFQHQVSLSLPKAVLDDGRILHLHGSIDLTTCENPNCRDYDAVDAARFQHAFMGGSTADWDSWINAVCKRCGSELVPMIVAPTMLKAFDRYSKTSLMWQLALRALRRATRLIIVGFRVPPSDFHVGWLLRSGLQRADQSSRLEQVVVVSLDDAEDIERRIKTLMPPTAQPPCFVRYNCGLRDYVEITSGMAAR